MSVEDLKKYGQMCTENEEIRNRAKEIGIENIAGQMAYAKELGLVFNLEDMEALAKEAGVGLSDELSEEELEKVAGGIITTTAIMVAGAVGSVVGAGASVATAAKGW
jgi:predicted ribosomally synthesized peptide with nif11-like leader